MSEDLFDNDLVDWDNVKDDPFFKDDGVYRCKISEAAKRGSKKGGRGLSITYLITEGEKKGQRIQEWKTIPWKWEVKGYPTEEDMNNDTNQDDKIKADAARNLSFLKIRMQELGFAPSELNDLKPQVFLDLPEVDVTIYHDKTDREKIKSVSLPGEAGTSADPFPYS